MSVWRTVEYKDKVDHERVHRRTIVINEGTHPLYEYAKGFSKLGLPIPVEVQRAVL